MNRLIIGAAIGVLPLFGSQASAQERTQGERAPTSAMTPEQQEALRQAFQLPPGSEVEVEFITRDGGSLTTMGEGYGIGAGASAEGGELSDQFTGSAPAVGLGADGSQTATGGSADRDISATGMKIPPLPWANPLFWMGVACLGAAGFGVYAGLRRLATVAGVAGAGLLAIAFYPAILLWGVAAILLIVFGPYLYTEFKKREAEEDANTSTSALRAVVAGVDDASVPDSAKSQVKAAIAKHADGAHSEAIDAVKQEGGIGKYS